jgi:hypothetical protein
MATCGNTEQVATKGEARAALQTNRPWYFVRSAPPGLTIEQVASHIETACRRWTDAGVNVTIVRATDLAQIGPNDVVDFIETHPHSPGVVADQTLGNGFTTRHRMRLSTRWDWTDTETALAALTHELGHFWGLEHFPPAPPPELMEPILDGVTHPQPTEVAVVKDWFKQFAPIKPSPPPAPDPAPPPPFPDNCCFRVRPTKQALYARIPMDLTADEQAKVAEAKKAIAALDCQTIAKTLLGELLNALAGRLCPPQSKEAPNA